jgi:rhodanese-related sulfurtransferase
MPIPELDPGQAAKLVREGRAIIVDVREMDEYRAERIPGTKLMPLSGFRPEDVPQAEHVILQCRSGKRSMDAAHRIAALGRTGLYNLKGGIIAWREAGLPVEQG